MADITKCAKCGACTSVCPVYLKSGEESLTARGRIHLLAKLTSQKQTNRSREILSKCLLCGACYAACPRGIDTPAMIIKARGEKGPGSGLSDFKKFLLQKSLSHPESLPIIKTGGKLLSAVLPKESGLRLKLSILSHGHKGKNSGFTASIKQNKTAGKNAQQVAYFTGCLANYLQQDIAKSAVSLLSSCCKIEAVAPKSQSCCGMAAHGSGSKDDAVALAKKNIAAFCSPKYEDLEIFTSCATCYAHLKSYPELLKDDPIWQQKAISFSQRLCEFSSYLIDNLKLKPLPEKNIIIKKVFYHDPCHLRFPPAGNPAITSPPRELLAMIPGLKLVESAKGPRCCGQGGLFNISHPKTSEEICRELLDGCYAAHPEIITTTCSGCLCQITEGLARDRSAIKAVHLANLLADHLISD